MNKGHLRRNTAVFVLLLFLVGLMVGVGGVGASPEASAVVGDLGLAGKIGEAIQGVPVGTGPGQIDPNAAPGFLGIPGGAASEFGFGVPVGNLGRLDFLDSRCFWWYYGGCGTYDHLRSGALCRQF